jgi:hypothetical protein
MRSGHTTVTERFHSALAAAGRSPEIPVVLFGEARPSGFWPCLGLRGLIGLE